MQNKWVPCVLILGIILLIAGGIVYSHEYHEKLEKTKCTLNDKNYTTNQCTGHIDVTHQASQLPCSTPYYQLIFVLTVKGTSSSVEACQRASFNTDNSDPVSHCSCCTDGVNPNCGNVLVPRTGNSCYQIWAADLTQYNNHHVGEIDDCWLDKDGSVSLNDKPDESSMTTGDNLFVAGSFFSFVGLIIFVHWVIIECSES